MKSIVLIATLLALTEARPESPPVSGYNYPTPGQRDGSNLCSRHGVLTRCGSARGSVDGGGVSFEGGSFTGNNGQHFRGGFNTGMSLIASGRFGSDGIGPGGVIGGVFPGDDGSSSGGTIVQKHIYVHVAPEEPQEDILRRQINVAPAQKHYKIIFIKAPSPPTPYTPTIPLQPQNEEKTLVYVLVKKPEEQGDIVVPTPLPTQPSKPEVFFIRYKNRHQGITGGISTGGISTDGINVGGDSLEGISVDAADSRLGRTGQGHGNGISTTYTSPGVSTSYGPALREGGPY